MENRLPDEAKGYLGAPSIRGDLKALRDLFEMPGGKEFWLIGGGERSLTFTVAPISRSVLTLSRYLADKGFFQ
ncbi:hypothetical protein BDI4_1240008 [Burkholderia diffusa]|nr:hypothetical protein BDI4_1240008 [Burkholderia diffusa]